MINLRSFAPWARYDPESGYSKALRGRGSQGKIKVFGMLERQGKIFTTIMDNMKAENLMRDVQPHAKKGSAFYTDQFKPYKSLKSFL